MTKNVKFFPTTRLGMAGIWLSVGFASLFVLKATVSLPLPAFIIFAIGISGVIVSIIAFFRHERSVLFILLTAVIGAFVLFWLGGEIFFPH